jgi:hypothetical protein
MSINETSFQLLSDKKSNKIHIQSIAEYQEYMQYFRDKMGEEIWYRGVSNCDYQLIPSIYRDNVWNWENRQEKNITHSFIHRAKGYIHNSSTIGIWEWYQIMQHHGLPTRLLDWTEGYLIALYFSVRNIANKNIPAVWVLNPHGLNEYTSKLYAIYFTDSITRDSDDNQIVDKYLPESNDLPTWPIALNPPFVDERMSSQKSCFTVHGKNMEGFESIYKLNNKIQLFQLTIELSKAESIRDELHHMGITEATLFPDLDGLARELRQKFKMKI